MDFRRLRSGATLAGERTRRTGCRRGHRLAANLRDRLLPRYAPEKIKKALEFSAFWCHYLAPQPGLEPGTYGLTENLAFEKPL
jgi:hypothetical protein